jgi:hypothetical protein
MAHGDQRTPDASQGQKKASFIVVIAFLHGPLFCGLSFRSIVRASMWVAEVGRRPCVEGAHPAFAECIPTTVEDLPDEMLTLVFSFVPCILRETRLVAVRQRWRCIAIDLCSRTRSCVYGRCTDFDVLYAGAAYRGHGRCARYARTQTPGSEGIVGRVTRVSYRFYYDMFVSTGAPAVVMYELRGPWCERPTERLVELAPSVTVPVFIVNRDTVPPHARPPCYPTLRTTGPSGETDLPGGCHFYTDRMAAAIRDALGPAAFGERRTDSPLD